ncbi:PGDH: phosphoglycerate dehydrogenase [Gaiella occulta]|uniref:D-3-phosphoglycerate dehydrogenase n=1 Tax=Gaiella occulta TaxID=1002870 RepID=A0A7M2YZK3_9ACTN|nr:phosphoglycerate dehydrogenase [Gaiella occulta]RDI75298.1 PGDH: phosphoglycerate dehydrogenase [Gaiella occulta]
MRVLVREPIADAGIELLRSKFDVDVDTESPLEEIIAAYDGIVIRSATKVGADLIERAERLKVIGRAGVGVDNVDVEAATRRGIVVANAPESTVVSAAEQTVGLIVALARNIPQAHAALKQGRWERSTWSGVELDGKTLGVLGFGRIGQQVARRAIGLGMRVVAYDPFVTDDRFRELGVEHAPTVDDVLAAADFLTLHSPLNDETRGMINRESIAKMRDGARLVNAARGALVDEDALVEAIRSGKLAGAALDVFSREPYTGPLLELEEVVVTPHLAASTDEAQDRAGVIIAEQVAAALEGGLVSNAVNIPVVDQADLEVLGPFIPLASKLGRLAVELAGGRPGKIVVAAHGPLSDYDTRLLTMAALNGVFQGRVDQAVNYVNAPLLAAERGIAVSEERLRASRDYTNLVEVRVTPAGGGDEVEVSGTTIGPEPRLFLASAYGFGIDIELASDMVFFRYDDVPGVIGRVGTMFGENGANIANMAVSRTRDGSQALMALSVDEPPSDALIEELRNVGFGDARFIELG